MIEIVPAIDIIDGKCVRLTQGDYDQKKTYNDNPLEVAKMFEDHGIKRLHVVDLEGAKAKKIINFKTLEKLASQTHLIIDFGGGIKSDEDIRIAFESGAKMITGGSVAVTDKDLFLRWLQKFGGDKIILGADVLDKKVKIQGWTEETAFDVFEFIDSYKKEGISNVICTDISKDGMLQGPSIELYKQILEKQPDIYLIASGGISKIDELYELQEAGIKSVIIGKAIYEGKIDVKDLMKFIV